MKKIFALIIAAMLCITGVVVAGCGSDEKAEEVVPIEQISIVAPTSTEIKAGEKFTLEYTVVPESAAEKVKVNWKIDNSHRLSYKDGEFTALTCGTVKVTAQVKGNEATDEIELKVTAPDGFTEYSNTGYSLVRPSAWNQTMLGQVRTWLAADGVTNMNITTEALNAGYFSAPASSFQTVMETTFSLMGFTVTFTEPTTVKKSTYLGVERLTVNYVYTLKNSVTTVSYHQTQMIINNSAAKLSCVLTVTFLQENFDDAASQLQETIFSQFMPD